MCVSMAGFSVERMSSRIWRQVTVRNLRSIDEDRNDVRVSHEHLKDYVLELRVLRGHTRESVQSPLVVLKTNKYEKEATFFMASQVMRITLKAYDHQLVDASAKKIIETVKKNGSQVSGPVPLPTKKEVVTILRAVHKYKDSREQFEQRTHKRLIDIIAPNQKTIDALQRLEMPAGVNIVLKMKTK